MERRPRLLVWERQGTKELHGYMALLWLLIAIPGVLFWRDSVPFLVGVSIYANVVGRLSSWQASRIEVMEVEAEANKENETTDQEEVEKECSTS